MARLSPRFQPGTVIREAPGVDIFSLAKGRCIFVRFTTVCHTKPNGVLAMPARALELAKARLEEAEEVLSEMARLRREHDRKMSELQQRLTLAVSQALAAATMGAEQDEGA
jgi:hypothetical protein